MDFTHVTAYSEQNADTLSGGIRQRVFFSMILAQDSQIIVMDEPVTYLDPVSYTHLSSGRLTFAYSRILS